jgi:hypothetical protein
MEGNVDEEFEFVGGAESTPAPPATTDTAVKPSAPAEAAKNEDAVAQDVEPVKKAADNASVAVAASQKASKGAKQSQPEPEALFAPLLCLRERLPYHGGSIVYYDHPICSAGVIVLLLAVYFTLTCKCKHSLLYLSASLGMWLLLAVIVSNVAYQLFQRYVRKNTLPDNIISSVIAPRLACVCSPASVCLSKETMQQHMTSIYDHVVTVGASIRRAFLCEDIVFSLKTAAILFGLRLLGALFSGATLILLGLILLFTVPAAYSRFHSQVDAKVGPLLTKTAEVLAKVTAKIPGMHAKAE